MTSSESVVQENPQSSPVTTSPDASTSSSRNSGETLRSLVKKGSEISQDFVDDTLESTKEGVRELGQNVKNTAQFYATFIYENSKSWVSSQVESFKRTSSEWKDDVVSTIKMNTVDKFAFLMRDMRDNVLLKKKEFEIHLCEKKLRRREEKEADLISRRDANMYKYDKAILGIEDPDLRAQFEKQKIESEQKYNERIGRVTAKKENSMSRRDVLKNQEAVYLERLQGTKDTLNSQIDAKIEDVRDRYRLQERTEERENMLHDIGEYSIIVGEKKAEAEKLKYIISQKEIGTWSSRRKVKKELANLQVSIELHEDEVVRLKNLCDRLEKILAHGNKKVEKWEKFRDSYLGEKEEKESLYVENRVVSPQTNEVVGNSESTEISGSVDVSHEENEPKATEVVEQKSELGPKIEKSLAHLKEGLMEAISPFELIQRITEVEKILLDNKDTTAPSEKDIVEQMIAKMEEAKKPAEGRVIRALVFDIITTGEKLIKST